jgi:mono/diheme cytochrome c family protein
MNDSEKKSDPLSRSRVFIAGGIATIVLGGLVVLCAPGKPAVIAQSALPQNSPQNSPVVATTDSPKTASPASQGGSAGEQVYARFCASCHGPDGKAQTTMARMMNPSPTNFYSGPWKGEQSIVAITEVVKNGKGAMPAYGKEITSETELSSLAEYVLSLRKDKQP